MTVLLLGGTGRTGGRVLQQLLGRAVRVRAVVRSADRLPAGVAGAATLSVVEADLLSMSDGEFADLARGCDAVVSCLGHTLSAAGVFGRPRDLVESATRKVCRAALWTLRGLVPPARDNQRAADFLLEVTGTDDRGVRWTVVRPDSLKEGDVSPYDVHLGLVDSLFRPGQTRMANVAHFMCELVTDDAVWGRWQSTLPVVADRAAAR